MWEPAARGALDEAKLTSLELEADADDTERELNDVTMSSSVLLELEAATVNRSPQFGQTDPASQWSEAASSKCLQLQHNTVLSVTVLVDLLPCVEWVCSRCEKRRGVCRPFRLCEECTAPIQVRDWGTVKWADLSCSTFLVRAWNEFSCDSVIVLSLTTSVEDSSLCNNLQWVNKINI